MESWADKLYRRVLAWRGRVPRQRLSLTLPELLCYLWKRAAGPWLRGLCWTLRFGKCEGRLFVGKRLTLLFPRRIRVGRGVYLGDYSYINGLARNGIQIGNHVSIREFGWIQATSSLEDLGEGLCIGDNTYIGPRCILGAGGGIRIGSNVTIGAGVNLLAENHEFREADQLINRQGTVRQGIVVEDDVWIGNGAIILDGVHVGRGAVIGAASIVTKDVLPNAIVAGNPAKIIGQRGQSRNDMRDGGIPPAVVHSVAGPS
jgi:acetyltransferase-like isoleucine patch superfamily enzyme